MAHHHSPSPSGSSSRRRLSELLGEQQEPFYLDLYLLEKGCSPAFLDAAACGGGASACSTCWPRARSTGGRLLRRPAARRKKGRGVLRLLLSKILSGATTTAPAAAAAKKKRQQRPAAIGWRRPDADVKRTTPVRSANAGVPASPSAVECHHRTEVDEEREEEDDGEDEDEDESSKKQLSPVSVLERRLFEHLPPPPHAQSKQASISFAPVESSKSDAPLIATTGMQKPSSSSASSSRQPAHPPRCCPSSPTPNSSETVPKTAAAAQRRRRLHADSGRRTTVMRDGKTRFRSRETSPRRPRSYRPSWPARGSVPSTWGRSVRTSPPTSRRRCWTR
ncbi:hypothetical protein SEVIR_3G336600v4 [Setaria viridis]